MKKTNRIISVLLTFVMLLSIIPVGMVSAGAASKSATINVESVSAVPGSTVEVDIEIKDNPGILGATLELSYGEGLTLTNAVQGEAWDSLVMTKPGKFASPCKFAWDGQEISADQIKDGVILTLTFDVAEDATSSTELPINVSYEYGDVADANLDFVTLDINNGQVTVIDYTPGDLDGNGKVNSLDVIYLRRYITGGYDVVINTLAANVNRDSKINTLDAIMIRRFITGGYTDADGNPLVLYPSPVAHTHELIYVPAKEATTTEEGNIAYWYCAGCGKYFSDSAGKNEVKREDVIIPIVVTDGIEITYHLYNGDTYLESVGVNNPNPEFYLSSSGLKLQDLRAEGYVFEGWYDGAGSNGKLIKQIPEGSTEKYELYAHWSQKEYNITYRLYQTPLQPISDSKYLHYTIGKGLVDLPNPTLYNYIFLGWYTDEGEEVTEIPVGTTGNITLNAFWTSKRNLSKKASNIGKPYIIEDSDNGDIYFAYEIGTIENVPITDAIWTIQAVSGLEQKHSEEITTSTTKENSESIANTISDMTVDSGTWSLSEGWNENVQVNETWAHEHGMTQSEANTKMTTSSNTYSFTEANGGSNSKEHTGGTTTVKYNSKESEKGKNTHFDATFGAKEDIHFGNDKTMVSGGVELNQELSNGREKTSSTTKHTGSDKTKHNTTVTNDTTSWNNSSTSSSTFEASESTTVQNTLSQVITNTKGYGKSYGSNTLESETQGHSSTKSSSTDTTSTIKYATTDIKTTTSTYSTDGKSEGCYRLVMAGKVHVFGVVGYDVSSKSFFTYTYNIMDDQVYEFLDYSPDLNFNDDENCVIPFEIPYDIFDYVKSSTAYTQGLRFRTNSINHTAKVSSYTGTDESVVVPSYISSGGTAYKVTEIDPSAFAGKPIRSIALSRFIDELPNSAFENCTSLEDVTGYYTKIGNSTFSGCTNLNDYRVSNYTTFIGEDAFKDVPNITINVFGKKQAEEIVKFNNPKELDETEEDYVNRISEDINALASTTAKTIIDNITNTGAKRIQLNMSDTLDNIEYSIEVPDIDYFGIDGGKKNLKNFKMKSYAKETSLKEVSISDCVTIPLEIHSDVLSLEAVNVTSPTYCLLLSEDGVTINLTRDSSIKSENGKAIVCKNPNFVSLVDPDSTEVATDGVVDIYGNIYLCGTLNGEENITLANGDIIPLTESEFANYIKGFFTVFFDLNGGSSNEPDTKEVMMGSTYGDLPTPTRENFEFLGWYNGDELVTNETVFTATNDVTLRARWKSDWVLASNVPAEGVADASKWSYNQRYTTTGSSPTMEGWTQYDSTWAWSAWGNWSGWSRTQYYSSDSRKIETRTVTDQAAYTSYKYHIYRTNDGYGYGTQNYYTGSAHGSCTRYDEITLTYALACTDSSLGIYGDYNSSMFSHGYDNKWFYDGSTWHPAVTHTEWRYADRFKVYTYYFERYENKESDTEITASGDISNVQHWVKYIVK